jgi:hypothetical protein
MELITSIKQYLKTDTLGLMILTHGSLSLDVTKVETKTCPMNLKRSILTPPGHTTTTNIGSLHEMKRNILKSMDFSKFKELTEAQSLKYRKEIEQYHTVYEEEDEEPRTYSYSDMKKVNKSMPYMPYTVGHYTDEINEFTENPKYINKVFSTDSCDTKQNYGLGIYTLNNYRNFLYSIPANTNIISEAFLEPILQKLGIKKRYKDCIDENGQPIRLVESITYDELFSILEYLGIKNIYVFDISCEGFFVNDEECEDARLCRLIKYNMKREGIRGGTKSKRRNRRRIDKKYKKCVSKRQRTNKQTNNKNK